ncbi:MAG: hypothetical protein A2017_14495 [Lentisphaerae bacterium GWF2_44_16]|nr:MAG: hypothetical protein A2017_14495 [Lentisphaerae bacterium GWF2_44_16]
MRSDINLIAEKCGVSKATVSRVFTGKAGVRDEIKKKVLEAARNLNYMPKQVAAQENIAIIVSDLANLNFFSGFYSMIAMGIITEFTRSGYQIKIIGISEADTLGGYTKAAILLTDEKTMEENMGKLKNLSIPMVTINKTCSLAHSICSDHAQGIELAIAHMVQNGHEKIAIVLDNAKNWAGKERVSGYRKTMEKYKLKPMSEYDASFHNRSMTETMAILMKSKPSAVIVCGEGLTARFSYAVNLLNIRIPDDISVISCERYDLSQWLSPPHTTISQNVSELSTTALELIRDTIAGKSEIPHMTLLPNQLIIRESVKKI